MNTERILSAGLAAVAILAVGLSAATLASSMSTDPGDAVDIDWDTLPLGDDSEAAIADAAQGVNDQYSQSGGGDTADGQDDDSADGADGDSKSSSAREPGDGWESDGDSQEDERQRQGATGPQEQVQEPADGDGGPDSASQASASTTGGLAAGWPLWLLVAAALCLALVAVAYRYRERLGRALGTGGEPATDASLAPAPENEVERAWVELIERAGVPHPRTRTPRDCARLAVETGYDQSAVDRLRRTFEDVRYGTESPTDEQARIARETLASLDGESG